MKQRASCHSFTSVGSFITVHSVEEWPRRGGNGKRKPPPAERAGSGRSEDSRETSPKQNWDPVLVVDVVDVDAAGAGPGVEGVDVRAQADQQAQSLSGLAGDALGGLGGGDLGVVTGQGGRGPGADQARGHRAQDRKSTRLNS